jgi:hypothetical protein
MTGKTRTLLLSLTIIAVIVFSAFGPTIAYADGGTTETPAEKATEVSTEATPVPEATPVEGEATPEAVEAPATEEAAPVVEETAPVKEESAPATEEPVLNEVPENTTVTVLDANGEAQPLATQEAADAIAASDPIWCPEGVAPTPGANGCTASFSSFDELLTALSGNPAYSGAGTIYVEQGRYAGSDAGGAIDFNSPTYDLTNIRSSNLTVTGGWNTSTGVVDPATPTTFSDTWIIIGSSASPWGGSLTVNNISMLFSNGGDVHAPPPVTPENGLTLYATGDVSLDNVDVTNAHSAGADINAGGGVTIQNSNFMRNRTTGAIVRATGNVTVVNSSAGNLTNTRRQEVGLDIITSGAVTLSNVLTNSNRWVGTNIAAGEAVTIQNSQFNDMRDIDRTTTPQTFLGYGLDVVTPGEINLEGVQGSNNFLWGARLDAGGNIAIRDSIFNANSTESPGFIDDTGLFITGDSLVSLFNVTADQNRLYGAQINAAGTVSISDSSFSNNRGVINTNGVDTYNGHGLQITTLADIIINNTNASGNMLFGGQLNAGGQVAIANSTFSNTSTGSDANALGKGLEIVGGNTNLASVVLDNNQTYGATIQTPGTVWLQTVTATNNGADGVALQAACTTLLGGTYSGNAGYGLNLGNSSLNLLGAATFSNNGAGDMFPENPATCSLFTASAAPAANVFTSAQVSPQASDTTAAAEAVSLSTYMAGTKSAHGSIFFGKYAYAESDAGIQVFAYVSPTDSLAMD